MILSPQGGHWLLRTSLPLLFFVSLPNLAPAREPSSAPPADEATAAQADPESSAAGRLILASGHVHIIDTETEATEHRDGSPAGRPAQTGDWLRAGQLVATGPNGRAQIRFRDGALISLQPDSRFRIDQYVYEQGRQRGFYTLLEGTLRAISGLIGKTNPDDFRLDTPTATIGIRGTEFLVQEIHCAPHCAPHQHNGLNVAVSRGRVLVFNGAGTIDLAPGHATWVASSTARPQPTTQIPVISAPPTQQQQDDERNTSSGASNGSSLQPHRKSAASSDQRARPATVTPVAEHLRQSNLGNERAAVHPAARANSIRTSEPVHATDIGIAGPASPYPVPTPVPTPA
ncbi:MAG: FecR family protein, partial [Lautropia sp.]|nr:FecR family protein [Lautropia sp.]